MNNTGLGDYLSALYKVYTDNRKRLDDKWRRNKIAYEGDTGHQVKESVGMGNKDKDGVSDWQSKTVLNVTRTKVHAGEILVNDVICAGGELPFCVKPFQYLPDGRFHDDVNVPDSADVPPEYQGMDERQIFEFQKQQSLMQIEQGVESGEITPEQAQESAQQIMNAEVPVKTKTSAEQMENLIRDQLRRANGSKVLKQAVFSAAIYGEGIGKIYPKMFRRRGFVQDENGYWAMENVNERGIGMKNVSIFDFFTELEDRDIQANAGIFERMYMSRSEILESYSPRDPGIVKEELKQVAESHTSEETTSRVEDNDNPALRSIQKRNKTIEVLEFWGKAPLSMVFEFERDNRLSDIAPDAPTPEDKGRNVEITAIMAEGRIIKFQRTDGAKRPYFRVDWEEPVDDITPKSIADIIDTMQQSLNSAMRIYEDNKKLSANVMIGLKRRYLENKSDDLGCRPGKTFDIAEECEDVRKAIQPVIIPDVGDNVLQAINLYQSNANDQSMIPNIAYGASGNDSRTTAYEISIQTEKAGKYISEIVKNIDTNAIEPIVGFFYEWNMFDPEISNVVKGCFDVKALGFSSYQDRVVRMNKVREMLQTALSSEFLAPMFNLKALLKDYIKSNDGDPDLYLNDENETNNVMDIKFNQFQQAVGQQLQAMGQQMQELMKQIPSIANKSEADYLVQSAKAEKLMADAHRTEVDTEIMQNKMMDNRAKTISGIEQKKHQMKISEAEVLLKQREQQLKQYEDELKARTGEGNGGVPSGYQIQQ